MSDEITAQSERAADAGFAEIAGLIQDARRRALQAANAELVLLYWRIGQAISQRVAASLWGEGVVAQLAEYLTRIYPGLRGFTRRKLYRMRQFHEAYPDEAIVTALLTQLPWTHHLSILTASKSAEERDFYRRVAVLQQWTSRKLGRQISTSSMP